MWETLFAGGFLTVPLEKGFLIIKLIAYFKDHAASTAAYTFPHHPQHHTGQPRLGADS